MRISRFCFLLSALVVGPLTFAACADDTTGGTPDGTGGASGGSAGTSSGAGHAGSAAAGHAGTAGAGGTTAGGAGGTGGTAPGVGGGGAGGATGGAGGSHAGAAGMGGGAGGSNGGASGAGGSAGGAGGTTGGAGGDTGGSGGDTGGAGGGTGGAGGTTGGAGGSSGGAGGCVDAGGSGGSGGSAGAFTVAHTSACCGSFPIITRPPHEPADACVACINTTCCDVATACENDPMCKTWVDCYADCEMNDPSMCSTTCGPVPSMAVSNEVVAFNQCRFGSCSTQCADLTCVGHITYPTPTTGTYTFPVTIIDYQTSKPVQGLTVKVCGSTDAACASPLSTYTTDATGLSTVTAPSAPGGLEGYLEVSGTGIPIQLAYMRTIDPSFFETSNNGLRITAISSSTLSLFVGVAGVKLDPTRGAVIFTATDCSFVNEAGITVAADTDDAMTNAVYIKGNLPSKTATATDTSGSGALLNIPVPASGIVSFSSTQQATGTLIGSQKVVVRPGALTSTYAVATPLP